MYWLFWKGVLISSVVLVKGNFPLFLRYCSVRDVGNYWCYTLWLLLFRHWSSCMRIIRGIDGPYLVIEYPALPSSLLCFLRVLRWIPMLWAFVQRSDSSKFGHEDNRDIMLEVVEVHVLVPVVWTLVGTQSSDFSISRWNRCCFDSLFLFSRSASRFLPLSGYCKALGKTHVPSPVIWPWNSRGDLIPCKGCSL